MTRPSMAPAWPQSPSFPQGSQATSYYPRCWLTSRWTPVSCRRSFGPVAPVVTWRDEQEFIQMANGMEMGMAAIKTDANGESPTEALLA